MAGLAHELRERRGGFSTEEADELLAILAEQSDEVAAIVDDLLVAARADMGKVAISLGVVDLKREARMALDGAGIAARVSGDPVHAWADAQRVRQILRNLLSNALRYGGTYREVRLGRDDDSVWVEVADSGLPIPEEDRERIFDAYTGTRDGGSHVGSMGLGLFISRKLARLLGGDLAYAHDGAFGVFRLELPMAEEPQREPVGV